MYDHAEGLLAGGRGEEAAGLFDAILEIDPGHAEALNGRGVVYAWAGEARLALACFRRAAVAVPGAAGVLVNLGAAHSALGEHRRAVGHLQRALALAPGFAPAHNNLGNALYELGRHDDALSHFHKAVAISPDYAEAWNSLGNALVDLGRIDEAEAAFSRAIALAPGNPRFYRSLAQARGFAPDDPRRAAMEMLAEAPSLSDDDRIELHFALGKVLDDAGDYDRAFYHLAQGNALKRRRIVYDEAATLAGLSRLRRLFTAESLARRGQPSAAEKTPSPVFIVGMPRSGTTLVEQVLAAHPRVFGAGELDVLASLAVSPESLARAGNAELRRLGRDYRTAVARLAPPGFARITDKMPANFRLAGVVALALPEARIIHVRRDPVDTCLSCFFRLFRGDQPFAYTLDELGRYWRAYDELMDHWRAVLPDGVMIEVEYETLVRCLEAEARRMVAHCGLDWHPACLDFQSARRVVRTASNVQVRQPLYGGSIGRWRPYARHLTPLFEALAGA